jgi:ketosteroid isomerase-like protein
MSQENVEIVKASIDAYNREDWDAMFKDAAPGLVFDMSRATGLWSGVFDRDQLQEMWVDIRRYWDSAWVEPHEFIDAGDVLIVPWTMHVRGRDGIEVAARPTMVFAIRNGAIERITMYQEREEALEAVGLSEQDAHAES